MKLVHHLEKKLKKNFPNACLSDTSALMPQYAIYKNPNILINKATSCSHSEQLWSPLCRSQKPNKMQSLALRQWPPIPHLPLHFLAFLNEQIN